MKKRNFLKVFYFIFSTTILFSCRDMKLEDSHKADSENAQETENVSAPVKIVQEENVNTIKEFEDNFVVKVEEDKEPYKYRVLMSWKKFSVPRTIRIKKENSVTETDQKTGYFLFSSEHNKKVLFQIDVLDESRRIEHSFQKEVEIPRDFVTTSDNFVLSESIKTKEGSFYKLNRLYLSTSKALIIEDRNAILEVTNLYSDQNIESRIGNYLFKQNEAAKAAPNTEGRPGGSLSIRVKNLYGKVEFIMQGENGGDGSPGIEWTTRASDGRDGVGAACTYFAVAEAGKEIQRPCEFSVKNKSVDAFAVLACACHCQGNGYPPDPGKDGEKGRPGTDGKRGGDSGDINVYVENIKRKSPLSPDDKQLPEDFVKVSLIKGKKGNKGSGSPGQLGGIGGKNSTGKCTKRGAEYVNGNQGPKGDDGVDGIDGNLGRQCVSIPSEGVNFCD